MKAILLSVKPEWVAKILNGEKTIEVRKKFPKDYVGWVYLYCSKGNKKDWHLIEVVNPDTGWEGYEYDYYIGSKGYLDWCLEGKVVARFWCDKVEEIKPEIWTPKLEQEILKGSCLTENELFEYISKNNGEQDNPFFAIHISKLEIFDEPKELSEFHTVNKYGVPQYQFGKGTCDYKKLTKAPQNYCYIEGEYSMNKELTPLQEINKPICIEYTENSANDKLCYRRYQVDIIEIALKDYEKLKECYENELKNTAYYNNLALKYKKALETVIKWLLQLEYVVETDNYNEYLDTDDNHPNDNMSEEEYELLKEILK